ncbi:uncharacterized protein MONOS_12878 [Monocercomonoides exilis]|uniref:uncharacterized protein n=1 Tax=Monocercomonoides exilis TaxID=2049356 RepID=UPI00355A325E|nr:hypothetical protein MONOS_12878 [Monocercomonoides exilis]|eukprot:MONOS_12878.1-p1 / transcript=MONOS_12878.1 / gene=MONOS_12878 / organism=Monocercomonoides_exilis_PA203 / gene_product=unspecified product / transcript_product=unspecified product / location=Mono_scaffold00745:14698-16019(+) / protein_length=184 / sequence_SO=supercontig / SO=protein_coding / is_pseudo=false
MRVVLNDTNNIYYSDYRNIMNPEPLSMRFFLTFPPFGTALCGFTWCFLTSFWMRPPKMIHTDNNAIKRHLLRVNIKDDGCVFEQFDVDIVIAQWYIRAQLAMLFMDTCELNIVCCSVALGRDSFSSSESRRCAPEIGFASEPKCVFFQSTFCVLRQVHLFAAPNEISESNWIVNGSRCAAKAS